MFVQHLEEQLDRAYQQLENKERLPITKYPWEFRKPVMALRDVYVAKKDNKSYLRLLDRSFMGGFEGIVSDRARPAIESFATKAKKRWKKQTTL